MMLNAITKEYAQLISKTMHSEQEKSPVADPCICMIQWDSCICMIHAYVWIMHVCPMHTYDHAYVWSKSTVDIRQKR